MALVIMRHRRCTSLLQRQPGLRPIKGLHLALFIAAQYQGMLRRIQIQTYYVFQLLHELRITRHLKGFDTVRF